MLGPVGKGIACEDGVSSRESPRVDNQSTKIAMPCGAPVRGWPQARPQQGGELGWREPCWTQVGSIQGTCIKLTPLLGRLPFQSQACVLEASTVGLGSEGRMCPASAFQVLCVHWWLYGQETHRPEKFQPEVPQNLRLEEGSGLGTSPVSFMTEGAWK